MNKHTPGPWVAKTRKTIYGFANEVWMFIGKTEPRATGYAYFDIQPYSRPEEAEANARLIASAPDLLAACKQFAAAMRKGEKPELLWLIEALHVADAAVALAEGQPS